MASNVVRAFPAGMPPQPSQQGWVWNGSSWCWFDPDDCPPCPPPVSGQPFPCPPPGFPTQCPPWFPPPAGQAPWYPGANGGVSFSATPPVNPIRGNFWWDGLMLHLFDGAAWVDIGPGAGSPTLPGQVGKTTETFSIVLPTNVTGMPAAPGWGLIPFTGSTPLIDTQAAWNPATSRLTPQVAGAYLFVVRGYFQLSPGPVEGGVAIVKNDSGSYTGATGDNTVAVSVEYTASTFSGWLTATGVSKMNGTTDYIRMFGLASTGTFLSGFSIPLIEAWLLP